MRLNEFFEQYYLGPEGKTLFCRPYKKKVVVHDDSFDLIKTRDVNLDDRSFALVSAMISENYIDRILKILLPTFKNERPGSASMKINLLAAFNIIPKHLTTAAELLNQTRNEFAHRLKLASFSELDQHNPKLTKSMRGLCKSRKITVPDNGNEIRALFETIFTMATAGIVRYEENVRFYMEFTRSEQFIKSIEHIHSTEVIQYNSALMEALRLHQSARIGEEPPSEP